MTHHDLDCARAQTRTDSVAHAQTAQKFAAQFLSSKISRANFSRFCLEIV